jgi:hypothetical protein
VTSDEDVRAIERLLGIKAHTINAALATSKTEVAHILDYGNKIARSPKSDGAIVRAGA